MYTLNKLSENGHCFAVREQLIETAEKLLDVEAPELEVRSGRRFPREFFPAHFFCMRTKKGAILTPFFIFNLFMSSY